MPRTKVFDEGEVLERAMDLFWAKGYQATSAQDLVDRLEISRSSLYATYGDKHSLFVRALQRYRRQHIDPVLDKADTVEDLEGYLRELFGSARSDALTDHPPRGCFMVNSAVELAGVDAEVAAIGSAIMRDTETAVRKVIERGQKAGLFTRRHSPRSLARYLFNALNGLRVTIKFDDSDAMFTDILEVSLATLRP